MPDVTRIIEQTASETIYNDDWLVKDSVNQGTTKIQPSVLKAWINDGMATVEELEIVVGNIADTYNTSESYVVDDLCIHEYALYKCIGATTGTWDSTKWQATTIAEIIATIDLSAEAISYDNTSSGLEAENVQDAIDEVDTALETKAEKNGVYDDLVAGNLLSDSYTADTKPYLYRQSPSASSVEQNIIGGTVAWNQLVQNGNFADSTGWTTTYGYVAVSNNVLTFTVTNSGSQLTGNVLGTIQNHKYIVGANIRYNTVAPTGSVGVFIGSGGYDGVMFPISSFSIGSWTNCISVFNRATTNGDDKFIIYFRNTSASQTIDVKNCMCIDLTQAFGSTIADYVYTLEQATAGSGIAWLKANGFLTKDYYPYDAGSLQSVNVASRKVYDSNDTLVATYPLDSNLTLRGIPKLDANNNLYYDGDVYSADGSVKRKYGIVDLGTLGWTYNASTFNGSFSATLNGMLQNTAGSVCAKYQSVSSSLGSYDKAIYTKNNGNQVWVKDTAYTDAPTFTTAMSGVYLVYELATPTTESADAYENPQLVGSTEEFIDTRDVPMPVGGERKYYTDLKAKLEELAKIPDVPSTNGTYTLKATRSASGVTYSWVSG